MKKRQEAIKVFISETKNKTKVDIIELLLEGYTPYTINKHHFPHVPTQSIQNIKNTYL